jgi:hypothetical protein
MKNKIKVIPLATRNNSSENQILEFFIQDRQMNKPSPGTFPAENSTVENK